MNKTWKRLWLLPSLIQFFFHSISASGSSLSLLELLGNLGCDSIHIGSTLLGQGLSVGWHRSIFVLIRDGSDESGPLQFDEAVSDALTSGDSGSLGAGTVSLLSSVVLSEGVDSNLASHVELVGNGGSSDVEPVLVIRGKVLETCRFIVGGPLLNIIFN